MERKVIELTEEQRNTLTECVIAQIKAWGELQGKVYHSSELYSLTEKECDKLNDLLNVLTN